MSVIIETPFGRLRKIKGLNETQHPKGGAMSAFTHQCPVCEVWAAISQKQLEGKVSIFCSPDGPCTYHETHDFRPHIPAELLT